MSTKDYYKILGVDEKATADEIKKAFRRLAKKYHPDRSKEPGAEERFKEINEAHTVLEDPKKREEYDRMRKFGGAFDFGDIGGGSGRAVEFDFSSLQDLMGSIFGGSAPTTSRSADFGPRSRPRKGADIRATLRVPFDVALHGGSIDFGFRRQHQFAEQTVQVKIPKGVASGQVIRLAGMGDPGEGGHSAGDLLLEVQVDDHPVFRREGIDIHSDVTTSMIDAVLGGEVDVKTVGGTVTLKIPPGTQPGDTMRLRGRGVSTAHATGDHLVHIRVAIPKRLTDEQRALLEKFRATLSSKAEH